MSDSSPAVSAEETDDVDHGVYVLEQFTTTIGGVLAHHEDRRITEALVYAQVHMPATFAETVFPALLGSLLAIAGGPHGAASQSAARTLREAVAACRPHV